MRTAIAFLMLASLAFGQEKKETPLRSNVKDFEVATGRVSFYGVGSSPYFALSRMPEGIDYFVISSTREEQLGNLVLFCAERGLEVIVFYTHNVGTSANVFEVRVEGLAKWEKTGIKRPAPPK